MRHRCVVRYQVATYSGTEIVYVDGDAEPEEVLAKAEKQLRRSFGAFPLGVKEFYCIEREPYDGE